MTAYRRRALRLQQQEREHLDTVTGFLISAFLGACIWGALILGLLAWV